MQDFVPFLPDMFQLWPGRDPARKPLYLVFGALGKYSPAPGSDSLPVFFLRESPVVKVTGLRDESVGGRHWMLDEISMMSATAAKVSLRPETVHSRVDAVVSGSGRHAEPIRNGNIPG